MKWTFSSTTFHRETVANFTKIEFVPTRKPDFVSASGSMYWYEGDAVVRFSDHWGTVAGCAWVLDYRKCREACYAICKFSEFVSMHTKEGREFDMALMTGKPLPRIAA